MPSFGPQVKVDALGAGAYLENEGGGGWWHAKRAAILATPLLPRKKVTFTTISHDNDNNAHMCIGVVITQ